MKIALDIVAGLLGLAALGSATGKQRRVPAVIESLTSVGVQPQQVPLLAAVELVGALGLLAGIWSKPLGIAASFGFVLYFLGAVSSHVRVQAKLNELVAPGSILLVAIVTAILELKR